MCKSVGGALHVLASSRTRTPADIEPCFNQRTDIVLVAGLKTAHLSCCYPPGPPPSFYRPC